MFGLDRLFSSLGRAGPSGPVFVSHSSRDQKLAWALTAELESAGIRCWLAPRDIRPGTPNYGRAIIEGIATCHALVLPLTESSNSSQHVMKEAERAVNRQLPILVVRFRPVVLSRDLEYYVSSAQSLDALTEPAQQHFPAIATRLRDILARAERSRPAESMTHHEPVPASPPRPAERVVATSKERPSAADVASAFEGCPSKSLHIAPQVPSAKAQGAIGRYAPHVQEAEILALFDATLFATGSDGFMLTAAGIHWHNAMSPARCLKYTEIFTVAQTEATFFSSTKILLNGEEIDITCGDGSRGDEIARRLAAILKRFAPNLM